MEGRKGPRTSKNNFLTARKRGFDDACPLQTFLGFEGCVFGCGRRKWPCASLVWGSASEGPLG